MDLRKRVVKAVKEDKQKVKDVAKRFVISIWSVNRYLKLDALGDLEAKQPSGRRRRLDDQGLRKLENQVKKHKDWTLEQHAQALEETTGISLKKSAIGVYFKRLVHLSRSTSSLHQLHKGRPAKVHLKGLAVRLK